MLYGANRFAVNPRTDGRIRHFATTEIIEFRRAKQWLHHDQFARLLAVVKDFIRAHCRILQTCHVQGELLSETLA
jgi:hypothetical protein